MYIHTKKNMDFLIENGLYIIPWSIKNYIKFLSYLFKKEYPNVHINDKYTCYFVSCGTWGAYREPNTIFFCPIDKELMEMTQDDLIYHEMKHIKYSEHVKGMTHKEKEKYIDAGI